MLIRKRRIQNLKCLLALNQNAEFTVIVNNVERFSKQLQIFGFSEKPFNGMTILPSAFNKQTRQNAETFFTIDKTKGKELYTQTVYWTRTEWAGRDQTREVIEFRDFTRKRYHRDYHKPYSVEFTYFEKDGEKYITSETLYNSEQNSKKNLNTINMVLSLFGECFISFNDYVSNVKVKRLNWHILPRGKYPWEKVKNDIETISQKRSNTQKQIMFRNCELINSKSPDFVAYGTAGFLGYAVFGFTKKNIYILESVIPNNATYIFENNWEQLSKLSKAEILNNNLCKQRIIHNSNWECEFSKIWEANYE